MRKISVVSFAWNLILFCNVISSTIGSRDLIGTIGARRNPQCPAAFFNFGTSLTDTGNLLNALPYSPDVIKFADAENPPYGNTFFRRPAKRYSDGRLIPDFFSLAFGFPLLDTYVSPTVFNFTHGVNFAIGGVGVTNQISASQYLLPLQIKQFVRFQSSALIAQSQPECLSSFDSLPPRENFQNALYTLEFGSSDLRSAVHGGVSSAVIFGDIIPTTVKKIADSVTILYQYQARNFLIFNVYPLGCSPQTLTLLLTENLSKDKLGCIASVNEVADAYNRELFLKIGDLKASLPDANIILFDFYNATTEVLQNPSKYGFDSNSTLKACCGAPGVGSYNFNPNVTCAIDGSISCQNPDMYVSWDGVHFTDSFYGTVSRFILSGQFTSPSIDYDEICNLNFTNFPSSATYEKFYGGLCNVWYA
ncbi:hypothetical protein R1flu_013785 [Riccia fluitans]|uniref:Esterase n=1 Tax=Riccia fluitans TaxID=41844 RepID=A0ABD1YFD1_9MARC